MPDPERRLAVSQQLTAGEPPKFDEVIFE